MGDPWAMIGTFVGGGGVLFAVSAIIVYVTRGAIAAAVQQAGAREIERPKGDLAKDLEKERQAFARELEQLRTQLTLEAEVRKQAAALKVAALIKIARATDIIMRVFGKPPKDEDPNYADWIAATDEYFGAVRDA